MIGAQIAALRHARGLTQERLAARARVSVDVIRRLEQGQRTTARFATLQAIAAALGTELSVGFAGCDAHPRGGSAESSDMNRRDLLRLITSATATISVSSAAGHRHATSDPERFAAPSAGRLGRASGPGRSCRSLCS